ncbi:hypothetical protein PVAND_016890 [Polypedilum vanderplanki]|uniref:Uncharacterized protein n=1 Tax=Polypedilum vanderplanki TaxID=319348 RepID=A0A9J6BHI6_POLVA|nr:hypothetical protein PVAND_016890 [Polypedilum vanderplanki]
MGEVYERIDNKIKSIQPIAPSIPTITIDETPSLPTRQYIQRSPARLNTKMESPYEPIGKCKTGVDFQRKQSQSILDLRTTYVPTDNMYLPMNPNNRSSDKSNLSETINYQCDDADAYIEMERLKGAYLPMKGQKP